jgi:hypothetical protein
MNENTKIHENNDEKSELRLEIESAEEMASKPLVPEPEPMWESGGVKFRPGSLKIIAAPGWAAISAELSVRLGHYFSAKLKRKTLLLNVLGTQDSLARKYKLIAGEDAAGARRLLTHSCIDYTLGTRMADIVETVRKYEIKVVILNSWEFAAFAGRERNKLYLALHELVMQTDVCVIVFTKKHIDDLFREQKAKDLLGMLSMFADDILDYRMPEESLLEILTFGERPDRNCIPEKVVEAYLLRLNEMKKINNLQQPVGTGSLSVPVAASGAVLKPTGS